MFLFFHPVWALGLCVLLSSIAVTPGIFPPLYVVWFLRASHVSVLVVGAMLVLRILATNQHFPARLVPPELALLVGVMMLSATRSFRAWDSYRLIGTMLFNLALLLVFRLARYVCRNEGWSYVCRLQRMIMLFGLLQCVVAFLTWSAAAFFPNSSLTSFISTYNISHSLRDTYGEQAIPRASGLANDPNFYASFLILPLLMALPIIFRSGRTDLRLVSQRGLLFLLFLAGIFVSLSATGIAAAMLALWLANRRLHFIHLNARAVVSLVVISVLAIVLVLAAKSAGVGRFYFLEKLAALSKRLKLWQRAWQIGMHYPLLGVGPDNAKFYKGNLTAPSYIWRKDYHNTYLTVFAECGLFGLFLLLWFVARVIWRAWRELPHLYAVPSQSVYPAIMLNLAWVGFVAVAFHLVFLNGLYAPNLWLATAVLVTVLETKYAEQAKLEV
jgi:O-antigen ligase